MHSYRLTSENPGVRLLLNELEFTSRRQTIIQIMEDQVTVVQLSPSVQLIGGKEVAQMLGVAERSVYALPFPPGIVVKVGRLRRYHPQRLREWIDAGGNQPSGSTQEE